MWCHLMLLMPIGGLILFLALPWQIALPTYLIVSAISLFIYYQIVRAMARPVQAGPEALVGATATVITGGDRLGQVQHGNELWSAVSEEKLAPGEGVTIVGFQGMKVIVRGADQTELHGSHPYHHR